MDDVEDGLCLSAGASVALVTSSLTLVSTFAATIFFASLFSWSYVVVSIVGSINYPSCFAWLYLLLWSIAGHQLAESADSDRRK